MSAASAATRAEHDAPAGARGVEQPVGGQQRQRGQQRRTASRSSARRPRRSASGRPRAMPAASSPARSPASRRPSRPDQRRSCPRRTPMPARRKASARVQPDSGRRREHDRVERRVLGRRRPTCVEYVLERRDEAVAVGEQLRQRAEVELVVQPGRRPGRLEPACRRPGSPPRAATIASSARPPAGPAGLGARSRGRVVTSAQLYPAPPMRRPSRDGTMALGFASPRSPSRSGSDRDGRRATRRSICTSIRARSWARWRRSGPHSIDLGAVHGAQYSGYLWPMGPVFALLHGIGLSPWVAQRIWLGPDLRGLGVGDAAAAGRVRSAARAASPHLVGGRRSTCSTRTRSSSPAGRASPCWATRRCRGCC